MRRIALVLLVAACGADTSSMPGDATKVPCVDATHDEDGDGIGDACDICPAAPDPLQRDTTEVATMIRFADGVGDACDPRPGLSGDKLDKLHTFADPAASLDWSGTGYAIDSDRARGMDSGRWLSRMSALGDGVYVQARLAWNESGSFDVFVDGDGVESGLVCSISAAGELRASEIGVMEKTKPTPPITGAITLSAWRLIDSQMRGELRCRVTFDGGNAELVIPTSDGLAIGSYGIAQDISQTEITSIVVYTSPLPKMMTVN